MCFALIHTVILYWLLCHFASLNILNLSFTIEGKLITKEEDANERVKLFKDAEKLICELSALCEDHSKRDLTFHMSYRYVITVNTFKQLMTVTSMS